MKLIKSLIITLIAVSIIAPINLYADYTDRAEAIWTNYKNLSSQSPTDSVKNVIVNVQLDMMKRQKDVADSLEGLDNRIKALLKNDPRKDGADSYLDTAEDAVDDFLALDVTKTNPTTNEVLLITDYEPYRPTEEFTDAEKEALKAVSDVNKSLLAPTKPNKNVIEGDVLEDFLPGIIRILMRFASLAVLVSFVVSGVFLVMAFGNDERITKAKHMLYYSLIGFAFVALAFAIVKAVTDIDFFGFI